MRNRFLKAGFVLTSAVAMGDPQMLISQNILLRPEQKNYFVFVNKDKNELTLRSLEDPSKVFKSYRAITGEHQGDKVREGDKKTPEGIYFVSREIPKKQLLKLHGSAAFELNYPNPIDRIHHQTGSGIWIHGVDQDSRMEKRFDTRGCVALGNQDVSDLRPYFGDFEVPVIIVANDEQALGAGLVSKESAYWARIRQWVQAWSSKDPEAYLSFYDEDFHTRVHSKEMNFHDWSVYKRFLAKTYTRIAVKIENLHILRHGKYAVAVFDQDYESNRFKSKGVKRLYLVGEPEKAKILSEEMRDEVAGLIEEPTNNTELVGAHK